MTLARERAINCAYLVSGDEDLREGVVAAQDMGAQVVLIGIPAARTNQSAALIREADEHVVLPIEHWEEHFDSPSAAAERVAAGEVATTPAAAQSAGRASAVEWASKASQEELQELIDVHPRIPRDLDIALLLHGEGRVGPLRERQELKHELRAGFWTAIKAARRTSAQVS